MQPLQVVGPVCWIVRSLQTILTYGCLSGWAGFGASSAEVRVFAAPWAAWTAVSDDLVRHFGVRDIELFLESAPVILERICGLHGSLVQQGTWPSITSSDPVCALKLGMSQKTLTSFVHKQLLRNFFALSVRIWTTTLEVY